jgi:DNA repair exonuclease SbcCD nuclease subunit
MPKIIGIASADFHIHKFRNFNEDDRRLKNSIKILEVLSNICLKHNVPLFFAGDWYHDPNGVAPDTHSDAILAYDQCFEQRGIECFAISGNHDMNERNGRDHKSPSHLNAYRVFKTFKLLDGGVIETRKGFTVCGVPYMNHDKDMRQQIDMLRTITPLKGKQAQILLLHSDAPGAETPEGFKVEETEHIPNDLDKFFKPWMHVVMGHIHKPQRLGTKTIMCGSPMHQNRGDEGTGMGYWALMDDGKKVFNPLKMFPEFKTGEAADNFNYWVAPDTVLVDEEVEVGEFAVNKSRKKLATLYLKVRGVKSKAKRRALIQILNQADDIFGKNND